MISPKLLGNLGESQVLRFLFDTPRSTPIPALCWDSGMLKMKYRIFEKQLNFVGHISKLKETTLAKQIFQQQKEYNFPGLINDTKQLIQKLELPDIIEENNTTKNEFKHYASDAILFECERELKSEFTDKLKSGPMITENLEKKEYLDNLIPANARQLFKFRSKMYDVKYNYKSDPKHSSQLWKCSSCQTSIETQDHVLWCPSYATLREGKDVNNA